MTLYNINRFHIIVMLCWQFAMFFATQMLFPIFSMYVPPWRCNDANGTTTAFSKDCKIYQACEKGSIEFENNYFKSAALEFDWFCGDKSYIIYASSQTQFFGVLLGTISFGSLSDCFGRRTVSIVVLSFGIAMLGLSGIGSAWQWLLFTRLLIGFSIGGTLVVFCTFIMEMLLPEQRMPLRACFNWGMARVFVTAICYLLPDWRNASLACALATFPVLLIVIFVLPESPTWLHSKGRLEDMRNAQKRIAKIAGVEYREGPQLPGDKSLTFVQSFKMLIHTGPVFRRILVLWAMWFTAAICGYSIDLNSSNLSGNLFTNQIIFSLLTAFSKMILVFVDTKFEGFTRRMLHQGAQSIVICCFLVLTGLTIFHLEHSIWVLIINVGGLCFIEYTWDACYLCGVETPPTELRSTSLGSCSFIARVGTIIAPTIVFLNSLWEPSAYLVVVILGTLNLIISYNGLVETKGVDLDIVTFETYRKRAGSKLSVSTREALPTTKTRSQTKTQFDENDAVRRDDEAGQTLLDKQQS